MQSLATTLSVNSSDMAEVDTILHRAVTAGDPLIAAEYANTEIVRIRLKGVSLAKLFFGMKSNWPLFQAAGIEEEFIDFIDAHVNFDARTADMYADMYKEVLENKNIPPEIREQLKLKPIQTLLLLTAAVREGDLDADDLENVVVLDYSAVRKMVRDARGDVTSSRRAVYARLVSQQGRSYPPGTIVVFGTDEEGHLEIEPVATINLSPRTKSGGQWVDRLKRKMSLEEMSYDQIEI